MALGRLFPRPPGFGSPPEAEPIPDGLLDCWDDAPDVDVQGIWDRVTAELGDQDAPPAGPRLRILLFPRTRIQLAGAAASLVVAALISGSVLLSGAEGEATGIRTDIAHLAIATRVALDDGEITAAELTALEDVGVLIHHYLTDPDMLAGVTDAELDQLIGTLAATRATLLEHRGDLADAAAARLETLSALAIRTRLARGTVGTLVVARPVDPSLVQSDEILAADELPVTVTAGDVGSLQILGDVVGLEVGGVSSVTGWTPTVERGFGRDIGVVFERNGATVEVTAQIVEDFIVLWVVGQALSDLAAADAGTGTAAGDATLALQDPVHTFAVRLAGFVVLGQDGEALEVLQVEAESGLRVLVGSDEEPLQIDFVGPASVVRFRAHRDDGVIRTSVQEIPLPVVTPDLRGMLDLTSAEPRAADDVATPGREDDGVTDAPGAGASEVDQDLGQEGADLPAPFADDSDFETEESGTAAEGGAASPEPEALTVEELPASNESDGESGEADGADGFPGEGAGPVADAEPIGGTELVEGAELVEGGDANEVEDTGEQGDDGDGGSAGGEPNDGVDGVGDPLDDSEADRETGNGLGNDGTPGNGQSGNEGQGDEHGNGLGNDGTPGNGQSGNEGQGDEHGNGPRDEGTGGSGQADNDARNDEHANGGNGQGNGGQNRQPGGEDLGPGDGEKAGHGQSENEVLSDQQDAGGAGQGKGGGRGNE